ncbi:hypothetical protein CRU92_01575 [Arcobacter sp. FW59]|nr:hypothetical protein CRU92_01575 [Arcobacter sp. FW59]
MKLKKSFTLIELLISIGIIGILVGIGVPIYNNYKEETIKKVLEYNVKEVDKFISNFAITTNEDVSAYSYGFDKTFISENIPLINPFKELHQYTYYYFINLLWINKVQFESQSIYYFYTFVPNENLSETNSNPTISCGFNKFKNVNNLNGLYMTTDSKECKKWFPNIRIQ